LCPPTAPALEQQDDLLLGKTLADKYRIEERLNTGGMARFTAARTC